ncbi:MAG: hypothetical protein IJ313_09455 [Clostridia bacterium]|nr:hypothetical protein [Clostridia bacterium]
MLVGLACALALGAIFYGAMAYQLADGPSQGVKTQAPEPGALLALANAQLLWERTDEQEVGGEICTVTTRVYRTAEGLEAEAVSAGPAAYIARLSEEKWTAQLITGFTLAGLDAVYSLRGGEGLLSCRDGEHIYMLRCAANEQTLYAMGAGAYFE